MTDEPAPAPDGRRPLGVIVIALIQLGRAALLAMQLLELNPFPDQNWFQAAVQLPEPAVGTVAFAVSRIIGVGLLAASLVVGLGVLRSRRWAWIGAILMSGLGLAFAIGAWWDGHAQYLAMAINVVAVFYLNQREVRSVFDAGSEDDAASHEHVVGP
ncbi:MAG TPA: hypothetical protein VID95_14105 [Candidatus Limnocylindrales bacterium]|jgi:uncharacterized membrane protein (DUF2068 family)